MKTGIILLVLIALVIYAVERNHHRRLAPTNRPAGGLRGLAGGNPVEDADLRRVRAELAAIADQCPGPTAPIAEPRTHSRFATAGRFHA